MTTKKSLMAGSAGVQAMTIAAGMPEVKAFPSVTADVVATGISPDDLDLSHLLGIGDVQIKRFPDLIEQALMLHFKPEEIDAVMQDAYVFWAIAGYTMNKGPDEVHSMWVKAQVDKGWLYGETPDELHHPMILPFESLEPRYKQVTRTLDLVIASFVSGLTVSAEAALKPVILLSMLTREAIVKGGPLPKDLLSQIIAQTKEQMALELEDTPGMFKDPLTEHIVHTLYTSLTTMVAQEGTAG